MDPLNVLGDFKKKIEAVRCSGVYFSRVLPVVQSSGYGKSRLAKEYKKNRGKEEHVVYISLQSGNGYPCRTDKSAQLLISALDKGELAGKNFFESVVHIANELDRGTNIGFVEGKIAESNDDKIFWQKVDDLKIEGNTVLNYKKPVTIVIDEARELIEKTMTIEKEKINLFRIMRRSLNLLYEKLNVVLVVMDTTSKIGNFAPEVGKDSSLRLREELPQRRSEQPNPFYMFGRDLVKHNGFKSWLEFGRPLWLAEGSVDTGKIPEYAARKLCHGTIDYISTTTKNLVAALGCRVPVALSHDIHTTDCFVGSHMATLLYLSEKRDRAIARYIGEAALACGGAYIMKTHANEVISAVREATMTGLVEPGPIGELIASVILLLGVDNVNDNCLPTEVTVEKYFKTLFKDDTNISESYEHVKDWTVHFNQFVEVDEYEICDKYLKYAYLSAAAITCRACMKYYDLMIPIKKPDKEEYGSILVSVKNYTGWQEKKYSENYLKACSVVETDKYPFVSLYMDVGFAPKKGKISTRSAVSSHFLKLEYDDKKVEKIPCIVAQGIDSKLYRINEKVVDAINLLIHPSREDLDAYLHRTRFYLYEQKKIDEETHGKKKGEKNARTNKREIESSNASDRKKPKVQKEKERRGEKRKLSTSTARKAKTRKCSQE